MKICHYCQETGINTNVEGKKLIKRLEKWYYLWDRHICQGSLAQGKPSWGKKLSLQLCLFTSNCILSGTKLLENLTWYLCLNCLKCHFFLVFWKQAVNTFDFTLVSFLQWSTNQCVLLCLHLQVLLQAGLCQRKSIVFEMLASRQHHPTDSMREKCQTGKLQFIVFMWPYERNSLCSYNYHSWSTQLRPETCTLTPAPL